MEGPPGGGSDDATTLLTQGVLDLQTRAAGGGLGGRACLPTRGGNRAGGV
jgi:hypothetical protein